MIGGVVLKGLGVGVRIEAVSILMMQVRRGNNKVGGVVARFYKVFFAWKREIGRNGTVFFFLFARYHNEACLNVTSWAWYNLLFLFYFGGEGEGELPRTGFEDPH